MIATFLTEPPKGVKHPPTVHAVFQVGRDGFKVKTQGYCTAQGNAADGTFQIPEWVFDGRQTYHPPGQDTTWQVCGHCAIALQRLNR